MCRFADYIVKYGEYIGMGSDRKAYLLNNKVYKIPINENEQGRFEKDIINILPEEFKQFLPNVEFFGRVAVMDFVEVAEDFDGWCSEDVYNQEDYYWAEDEIIYDYIETTGVECDIPLFNSFLDWLRRQGGAIVDILTNEGNFGRDPSTNQLKIVDWGWH